MSQSPEMNDAGRETHKLRELRWRAHPAREHAGRAVFGAALVLVVSAVVAGLVAVESPGNTAAIAGWGIFSALALVCSAHRFFLPSRYCIDEQGITAATIFGRRCMAWDELRRFSCDANGGYLSTRLRRSRLDAFGGVHVLFGERRDEVVAAIRERLRTFPVDQAVEGHACPR